MGSEFSSEVSGTSHCQEKPLALPYLPVPQTDTGSRGESRASGERENSVKESRQMTRNSGRRGADFRVSRSE